MKANKLMKNADLMCFELFKESVLTEKSVNLEMTQNCMTFYIHPRYNKSHIKLGIETLFGVNVKSVRIINEKSKMKTFRGRPFVSLGQKKTMVRVDNLDKIREVLNG